MIDDLRDELVADESGAYSLRDRTFKNQTFNNFVISPESRFGDCDISNVGFVDCAISNLRLRVFGASRLTNVSIVNLRCVQYWFHADNRLDNVSISGGAGSIVRLGTPMDREGNDIDGVTLHHPTSPDGVCLDLSGYLGTLDILHADPRNIRVNPDIHIICDRRRLETVDWNRDPVLSKTHFDIMLEKAQLSNTGIYVGSIIDESGKMIPTFEVAVAELRRRGVVD